MGGKLGAAEGGMRLQEGVKQWKQLLCRGSNDRGIACHLAKWRIGYGIEQSVAGLEIYAAHTDFACAVDSIGGDVGISAYWQTKASYWREAHFFAFVHHGGQYIGKVFENVCHDTSW